MKPEQMQPEHWRQIERLYHAALERDANERAAFLAEACAGDKTLRGEVESLLLCDARAENFIEAPALEIAAQLHAEEQTQSKQATGQAAERCDTFSATRIGPSSPESGSSPVTSVFVGDYRILRKLGEGGMGVVYEAEQQHPRRPVALKVIRGGRLVDEYLIKLFQREVQALARLKHPGIAAIYESDLTEDGRHYFAMELVRGVPLLDYVKGQRLTGTQAPIGIRHQLELFLKICDAISYAHQRGVIHRDLKPANILVADESGDQSLGGSALSRVEVKVLDFGLARITDEDWAGVSGLSGVGQIKGTVPYMSPEQIRGNPAEIDVRTDVYALGVILYEMLTERLPYEFEHATLPQAIRIICEEAPKPPSRARSEARDRESRKTERIDRDVETIVLKALEKHPERRYQSAAAMAEDVTRYLANQPIQARPPSALYQFRKLVARHKAPFVFLATLFMLLLGFAITMAAQSARIARERDKAVAAELAAEQQRDAAEQARNAERDQRTATEQARNAEQEQRLLAEANLARAEEQRMRAEQQELSNRRLLYTAQMNLVQQAWDNANIDRMQELLANHVPKKGQEDFRGFEWYYFRRLSHADLFTLPHSLGIISVAFSPDGAKLATQTYQGKGSLWDVATARELPLINDSAGRGYSVRFSPDGKLLARGGAGGIVKLFDAVTGRELTILNAPESHSIMSLAFSPNNRKLATGSAGGTVRLWEVATGKELISFKAHSREISSMAFSPSDEKLATGSLDGTVRLWEVNTGRELKPFSLQFSPNSSLKIFCLAFSPDGQSLAVGAEGGLVKVWEMATGKERYTLSGLSNGVLSLAYSPDGRMLATGAFDHTAKLWNAAAGWLMATFKGHGSAIDAITFTPDGNRLATGGRDGVVKLWDVSTRQGPVTFGRHVEAVWAVAFSPDGKRLVSGSRSQVAKVWDLSTGELLENLTGHVQAESNSELSNNFAVAFSPDSKTIATGGADRTIKLWDAATLKELKILRGHRLAVNSVAFSPDGKLLASGSDDTSVKLWDVAAGEEKNTLGHSATVRAVAFSPDGKTLATGSFDGTIRLWNIREGREMVTLKGDSSYLYTLAYSPDGKTLATGGHDHTVKLWDALTGKKQRILKGHSSVVKSVAFSPDGKNLATGSSDYTIKLWDLNIGQEVSTLKEHPSQLFSVAFSPDGKTLASVGDSTVKLWRTATDKEVLARNSVVAWPRVDKTLLPAGWEAGNNTDDFETGVDRRIRHSGKASGYIKSKGSEPEGTGTMRQAIKAEMYRGKRVRMSAYVRVEKIEGRANLWMRVDGDDRTLGSANMEDKPIVGTTAWKKYELVLDIPAHGANIVFGIRLQGKGLAWVDDFQFEVVDNNVPTTNVMKGVGEKWPGGASAREYSKQPRNLNFER